MSYRVAMTHRLGTLTEAWVTFEDMSTPWRWSNLPGLDYLGNEASGATWCRAVYFDFIWVQLGPVRLEPFHPRYGRPWLTSERRPGP